MDLKNLDPLVLTSYATEFLLDPCSCSDVRGLGAGDCKCGSAAGGGS